MTPAETLKREQAKAKRESLELALAHQLRAERITFEVQRQFWPGRLWRLDFVIDGADKLAVEVQGGTWSNGAHARGSGIERDTEKAAHAAIAGWRLIPVTGKQIKSGAAIEWIKQAMVAA